MDIGGKIADILKASPAAAMVDGRIYRLKNQSGKFPAITYFVYSINGGLYGDGAEKSTNFGVQVDIFTPASFVAIYNAVMEALLQNGFIREFETEMHEDDTGLNHKVIRFNYNEF